MAVSDTKLQMKELLWALKQEEQKDARDEIIDRLTSIVDSLPSSVEKDTSTPSNQSSEAALRSSSAQFPTATTEAPPSSSTTFTDKKSEGGFRFQPPPAVNNSKPFRFQPPDPTVNAPKDSSSPLPTEPPAFVFQPPTEATESAHSAKQLLASCLQQGNKLYQKEEYQEAIEEYSRVLHPDSEGVDSFKGHEKSLAVLYNNRAAAYMMTGQLLAGLEDCNKALNLDKTCPKPCLRAGRILLQLGESSKAKSLFAEAKERLTLSGTRNENQQLYNQAVESTEQAREFEKIEKDAQMFLNQQLYTPALKCVNQMQKLSPHSGSWILLKLIVYVQTKQWEEGIALSKEVYPKLLSDGDSTSCLQGISTKQRDQIVMYFARCLDASNMKNATANAQQVLQALIDKFPSECSKCRSRLSIIIKRESAKQSGNSAFKNKEYREAINFYTIALTHDSDNDKFNALLFSNRAAAHLSLGEYSKAIMDADKAIQKNAMYAKPRLHRARACVQLGRYREGIADYTWLETNSPEQFPAIKQELETAKAKLHAEEVKRATPHPPTAAHTAADASRPSPFRKTYAQRTGASGTTNPHTNARTKAYSTRTHTASEQQHHHHARNNASSRKSYGDRFGREGHSSTGPKVPPRAHAGYSQYTQSNYSRYTKTSYNHTSSQSGSTGSSGYAQRSTSTQTHYATLGISRGATQKDIKKAFRELAKTCHPDKVEGQEDRFKAINEAYNILSDLEAKRQYDLSLPL